MGIALVNGRVLAGGALVEGQSVLIDNGKIAAVVAEEDLPANVATRDLDGGILVPGFIDTQVNGGGGRLFNDDPSVGTIAAIGAAHRKFGTTGFLPTLISDDLDKIEAAMAAVKAAIDARVPGVLGIHVEGPFLNHAKKGIHDAAKLRELGPAEMALLTRPTGGRTLATLAPEMVSPASIRELADAGVIVSAGHSNATADCIGEALANGLTGFTHLFNAMSQLTSREPGVVGGALNDDSSWCGIIVDGHHVDPMVLRIALRATPLRRFMLVSDAMPSVGGSEDWFMLGDQRIEVADGKCTSADGTLAGSHLDMAQAVRNAVAMLGLELGEAVAMASANPAAFLGLDDIGRIAPGYRADLVLLDDALGVVESWIGGAAS